MWAKQSTAATLIIGPILDSTGAEYASAVIGDISLSKNGATLTALAAAATLTYIANGQYTLVLTTGNTDTLGRAQFTCNKSTYQMPPVEMMIVAAAVYDTLVTNGTLASTTSGRTIVVDASGLADANAVKIGPSGSGTAQTARDIGASVLLSSGTGTGQLSFTSGILKVDVDTIKTNPVVNGGTVTFPTGATLASTTGAVGSVTGAVGSVTGAVGSVTGNVGGNVTGSVGSVVAAVSLSAGDSQIIQTGTASAGGALTITIATAVGTTADLIGCVIKITSGTGANQERIITGYVNATKVVTVNYAWVTTPDATSVYAILFANAPKVDSSLKISGVVLADTITTYTGNTVQTGDSFARIGATGSGLSSLAPASTALSTAQWTNTLATNLGTLASHDPGVTLGTSTLTQTQVTGGAYALNNASFAFASGLDFTATQKTSIGTAVAASAVASVTGAVGSVTGNVGGNVTGSVGSIASGGITSASYAAGAINAAAIADGAIDRATFAADTGLQTIRSNTAAAGGATSITLDAGASAVDSYYVNDLIVLTGGTGAGQARFITAYVGATQVATVAAWSTNPDNTTTFAILPFDSIPGATAPTTAQIVTAIMTDLLSGTNYNTVGSFGKLLKDDIDAAVSSRMATYTQPTGFLAATFPTTVASTTNITAASGVAVSSIGANVITAASIAADAITDAKVAADVTIASVTGAVGSVTGTVGGIAGTTQTLDALQTAMNSTHGAGSWATATGFAVAGDAMTLTSAYDFSKGTAAMAEAYAANGVAPTPVQALYAIHQMLMTFSIAGTSMTVKKLDGSTTAFVVTLNDGTSPTGATRA